MKDGERTENLWVKNLQLDGTATGNLNGVMTKGNTWYVDGDRTASGNGTAWDEAFITIQEGVTAASAGDVVFVAAKTITDYTGDPTSYAETIIIPYATSSLALIGVSRGRTQGGLPQIKKGSGSTALLTVRAPGCLIANLGFNGYGSTGGGILLDDDYAAKAAFGTTILSCHLKNCACHTTDGTKGGAIYGSSTQTPWQVRISGCRFYKNLADIVVVGTHTVPQDWIIEDNVFSGPADTVDVNLYLKGGGAGINGVIIRNNVFTCEPAITSGSVAATCDLTGCVGTLCNNIFSNSGATMGASGKTITVPTTVLAVNNWQEDGTTPIVRT